MSDASKGTGSDKNILSNKTFLSSISRRRAMRIEKSTTISKTSDYSMVTNNTKNHTKNLNKKSYRPVSCCAKNYKNCLILLKTTLFAICTITLLIIATQNKKIYAQDPTVTKTVTTQVPGPNNTIITHTVTVYFHGLPNGPTTYADPFSAHSDWVDAIMSGFQYWADVLNGANGLSGSTDVQASTGPLAYHIWLSNGVNNPPLNQASANDGSLTITFDYDKVNNFNAANDGITTNNRVREGQVRDHSVEQEYNWRIQTIHELAHLLGLDAGINGAGTGFDGNNNAYRENLRDDNNMPPAPGESFTTWNYDPAWFVGGTALDIFNDNPKEVGGDPRNKAGDASNTDDRVPLGTTIIHPASPDAYLNHLKYQNMETNTHPIMGWDVKTEYARPFMSELELAMLLDSNGNLDPYLTLQQHFGMSIYQNHNEIADGKYKPFSLKYDWDANDHRVIGNYAGDGNWSTYIADYATGLHIVSGNNILSYEGTLIAGRVREGNYTAGIRIENFNNWLSIEEGSGVSGQFGVLIAAGSTENRNSNTVLINQGLISSSLTFHQTPTGGSPSNYGYRITPDKPFVPGSDDYPFYEGTEKLNKNAIKTGIYLDASAAEINMLGPGRLYSGIFIDEGVSVTNGINFIAGKNGETPEGHGNFINYNNYDNDDKKKNLITAITFGKTINDAETGNASYTIQWIDATDKNGNLIATVFNKSTGRPEIIGTGSYQTQSDGTKKFIPDAEASKKLVELLAANPNYYDPNPSIDPMKINSGIGDNSIVVGKFFGELYGGPWQLEFWGGTTEFYIPNRLFYTTGGDSTVTNDDDTSAYRITYNNDVWFVIGADDVGTRNLDYYDPEDRRQGASSILHLNHYTYDADLYADLPAEYRNGYDAASSYAYVPDVGSYAQTPSAVIYVFDQEVQLGSKNNVNSILQGDNSIIYDYTSSIILERGIDNWITIQNFYKITANSSDDDQPDSIWRLWTGKDEDGKDILCGRDFLNHKNEILQGLFRDPTDPLPYLNDKDHYEELSGIIICDDDLRKEIWSDTDNDGEGNFDKVLGVISLFNRYSGIIKENGNKGSSNDGVFAEFGIWNDRDYSIEFNYGQILDNSNVVAGTFIENYGWINDNYNVIAGTYIYNAFDAQMNYNSHIMSGESDTAAPPPDTFAYIVNGGEMLKNGDITAGTDLINLKTGLIYDTNYKVTANRDIYNFGEITNTYRTLGAGIYTIDGNIYNLDVTPDDIIGKMLGNRHIIAQSKSGVNTQKEHYNNREYFGTSGNLINTGIIGYTFGLEKVYNRETDSSRTTLASIETDKDLINLGYGEIYDTTEIKIGRDLYNEGGAIIKNTAYLNVTENVYNRDAGKINNTSFFNVGGDLVNDGFGVIDTGTKLNVTGSLKNGNDILRTDNDELNLLSHHIAIIKNFATIQVRNGNLINGPYGLITDNNTIISTANVENSGIIEHFFNFDAEQTLVNTQSTINRNSGIISVAQDAVLKTTYTLTNSYGASLFVFGDVKANQIVNNDATIFGTGSIILTAAGSTLVNNGYISPGGGTVLLPYSDDKNLFFKTYGTTSIGTLTIYGTLNNTEYGQFNITINPHPEGNPTSTDFDPSTMRLLTTTKSTDTKGRTDGSISRNDAIFVRQVQDINGNYLYGGTATINGGTVNIDVRSNIPGTIEPARYADGAKLPFLVTEKGLTVKQELDVKLPSDGAGIVLFDVVPAYNDYTYWLEINRRYKYGSVPGQTYNQRAVGQYLDSVGKDPNPESDFFTALVLLDNLSDTAYPQNKTSVTSPYLRRIAPSALFALDQLSGAIYATTETASFQNVSIVLAQLATYLHNDPLLTYCKDCRVYEPSKLDVWASTYGTLGGSSHDGNAYGYDHSTGGTIVGYDRLYINRLRAGIFGTFGSSTYSTDLLERSKATDISSGFYARKELTRGYLLGSLGFGFTDYHTTRQISFAGRRAKSDRTAYFWSAHLERALDLDSQIGRIQPYIGTQYIGNQFNNFNESGAGTLSLQGSSSNAHSLRTILGTRFTRHPKLVRGGKLETYLNFNWKIELLRYTKGDLTAHFTNPNFTNFNGTGSFKVLGNKQNRSWLDAGFGSNWDRNNTRISLGYNLGINGNSFFLHTGNIAFVYAR
jgi:uncharacterized protein with beta-barrel porin domain